MVHLCSSCDGICDLLIDRQKYLCLKCGNEEELGNETKFLETSNNKEPGSLFDIMLILGVYDPKCQYIEKKCPNCVKENKNYHLVRIIVNENNICFKCKNCNYTESNNSNL